MMAEDPAKPVRPRGGLPPIAALRAFDATFRMGGVRKAAESLGVHHAVVSRQLRHLEAWLGVALVKRTNNQVSLTKAAEPYHRRISQAFLEIDLATRDLTGADQERPLRVSCLTALAIQWLTAEIADFEAQHPEFAIQIKPSDQPANLLAHEADVNIEFFPDGDPERVAPRGLMSCELVRPRVYVYASPELARRLPPIREPSDLVDMVLLHGPGENRWRAWLALHGVDAPDELPGILCWHAHMAIAAAKLGRGVLLASRFLVSQDIERGDLIEIEAPGAIHAPYGSYFFLAREDRWSTPTVRAFRQFVAERMARRESLSS
jgi:DNA-binding transcriptional LysR family regulator